MTLRRDLNPMPDDVRQALEFRSLVDAYEARPPSSATITSAGSPAPASLRPARSG